MYEALEQRRLLVAGAFDPSFGTAGVRNIDYTLPDHSDNATAIQPDNKILVVGSSRVIPGPPQQGDPRSDFYVMRLNVDGSTDQTFGTEGLVATDFTGGEDDANAVAIQPDGKIVVAGSASVQ